MKRSEIMRQAAFTAVLTLKRHAALADSIEIETAQNPAARKQAPQKAVICDIVRSVAASRHACAQA
ncbi:hypothetical protein DL1_12535 [Thioclava dalianensis]|uniref:Uncharacterized protein n=1 Tax=Thioclava dalianensis TaxID=1185766 RepID=A0A074U0Z1_9RHOB|nr:hypothetical protein DL1_12535 [Thioclava dalianensis]